MCGNTHNTAVSRRGFCISALAGLGIGIVPRPSRAEVASNDDPGPFGERIGHDPVVDAWRGTGYVRPTIPETGNLEVDAVVRPGKTVSHDRADAVVEAGGEAVNVAVEGSGEAATVLVDTGGEVVEVAIENGGEVAAEATAEVIVAALEGL